MTIRVNVAAEGLTDTIVARCLLRHLGFTIGRELGGKGKAYLLNRLLDYNAAAHFEPWFVVVDLDNDALCVSEAIGIWLPKPSHEMGMCFRVAVRELESWLLADIERFAQFLHVSPSRFPLSPDKENDPKQTLVNIARTSKSRQIREDMVPRQNVSGVVGPAYAARLIEFTDKHWRPNEARQHSESLHRCMKALSTLVEWERP